MATDAYIRAVAYAVKGRMRHRRKKPGGPSGGALNTALGRVEWTTWLLTVFVITTHQEVNPGNVLRWAVTTILAWPGNTRRP